MRRFILLCLPNVVTNRITLMQCEAREEQVVELQSETDSMPKRRVTAMIDEADISRLEEIAQRQRVSLAWVIRDAVAGYLAEKSEKGGNLHAASQAARSR